MLKFAEFKKNINQYYKPKPCIYENMTKEQKEFLLLCRDNVNAVPFNKMAELWEELGWGKTSTENVRKRYLFLKKK